MPHCLGLACVDFQAALLPSGTQVDPSELFLPDARGRPDTEDEAQLHKSLKKLKNLPAQHDKVGRTPSA